MPPANTELGRFHRLFQRWARHVRLRLAARALLTGLAVGFAVAGVVAAALWWQRLGTLRPAAAALGAVGVLVALLIATRRRMSDTDVALYLDARLESKEAISTALELGSEDDAGAVVLGDAVHALDKGDRKRARPRVLRALHALTPAGIGAVIYLSVIPLPPGPAAAPAAPGSSRVQLANLQGLEKIERLENLDARDAEQRERLKQIAEEAKRLREELAKGMEKREAQSKIAKLRDDVAAERLKLGDQKNRAGLEAAVGKLAENKSTKDAAKALGDGDLVEFDKKMQELANKAEKADREAAKQALDEAQKAAREKGAKELAQALEEQKKLFEKREAKAEALRELARGMKGKLSEEALKDLEEFGQSGSPEAQKRLAESLEKALQGMTEEERKRLAERLQKQMEQQPGGAAPMTKEQIDDMAKRLGTPEGQKALEEQLKDLAKPDASKESERDKGLGDAERGGAEAERGLGGVAPVPVLGDEGGQPGNPGNPGNKGDKGDKANGSGGPGSKKDFGTGDHKGNTAKLDAKGLRSKATGKMNAGAPMQGSTMGRAPSRPGETANQAGTGALGQAGPSELGGVEGAEVPEEYREQVGRYFQP
ncbi:MAG: hypothetical protein IT377_33995 [Polyangiaceae bacterium]|nr:hypothetical protein [Polyangiaceae bacterium]